MQKVKLRNQKARGPEAMAPGICRFSHGFNPALEHTSLFGLVTNILVAGVWPRVPPPTFTFGEDCTMGSKKESPRKPRDFRNLNVSKMTLNDEYSFRT